MRQQPRQRELAEAALAGAHCGCRVALRELDRVEALRHRPRQILRRHVLADADEALPVAAVRRRGNGCGRAIRRRPLDSRRKLRRHEAAAAGVVLDAGARLRKEREGRLPGALDHEQIAGDPLAVDLDRAQEPGPPVRAEGLGLRFAQIDDAGDLDPRRAERLDDVGFVRADDDCSLAGLQCPVLDQRVDCARKQHADEVVAREDERLLDHPCGDDDPPRTVAVEDLTGIDGDKAALVDTDRRSPNDFAALFAQPRPVVDHDYQLAVGRGCSRNCQTGGTAADHEHVRPPVLDVEATRAAGMLVEPAKAGEVAKDALVVGPGPARADHRPVVEADGRERAAEPVDDGEQVPIE